LTVESFLPATGFQIIERSTDLIRWQGVQTNRAEGTNWLRSNLPTDAAAAADFFASACVPNSPCLAVRCGLRGPLAGVVLAQFL
jgi:hypothetical protein